ncbi:MAG: ribosome maturation factor RimP [Candidatus Aquicultor sp.]
MKRDPKVERIEQLIEPVIERENLELVDVELIREAIGLVLRILVDSKEDGISLDRLAKISQPIGAILEESGIITQKYTLEVSSPGVERPLKKPEHFKKFVGSNISVKTEKPIGKRKQFKGRLLEAGDKGFVIEVDGENFEIDYDNVAKARLQVELEF